MASSDPFLPVQPGEQPLDLPDSQPTEVEEEKARAEHPDPDDPSTGSGTGPTDEGLPPATATPFHRPDGESVDPAGL